MDEQEGIILVVDDSPFFRVSMANFLRSHYSCDIEVINSAHELLSYSRIEKMRQVLLIILDLHLADGSGLDAMKTINRQPESIKAPFLLVSANIDKATVKKAFQEGARDIIAKPIDYEDFKNRLDSIIKPEKQVKEKRTIMDFYRQITIETKRAHRGNYQLSIVMAGIFQKDDFKSPHKVSSYQKVIDLEQKYPLELKKTMRETDAIIGLSPSEYLFILPFTDKPGTSTVREKVTAVFTNLVNEKDRSSLLMIVGAATCPEDGKTPDELIAKIEAELKDNLKSHKDDPG